MVLPNRPQWAPAAIEPVSQLLNKSMVAFEWGTGCSTAWIAEKVKYLFTVDHDINWQNRAKNMIKEMNIDFSLYDATDIRYLETLFWFSELIPIDIVFVDGLERSKCFEMAAKCLKSGGLIVLDDSERKEYHRSFQVEGLTLLNEYGTQQKTSVFRKN